jgi:catechol-2,3-dioxygenase
LKGYVTNTNLKAGQIIEHYKELWSIEKAFRISKTDLRIRPIYHRRNVTGLFHTAIVYPTRNDLAYAYKRLLEANYPLSGASDHGVSEAIYLDDPDSNGLELYWDKPVEIWPRIADGTLNMYTRILDLEDLLQEIE